MTDPQRPPGPTRPHDDPAPPDQLPYGLDVERPDGPPTSKDAQKQLREAQRATQEQARHGESG